MLRRSLASRLLVVGGALLASGVIAAACSASNNSEFTGSGGSGASGSGSNVGGGGTIEFDAGNNPDVVEDSTCAAQSTKAEQLPLDIYIMLDQSGSMSDSAGGMTRWQAVTKALATFVAQPGTQGIGVGIQYFPLADQGPPCSLFCAAEADCNGKGPCVFGICTNCNPGGDSCEVGDYAKPDVEITPLPPAQAAIIQSMAAHGPTGGTPTGPALAGALEHTKGWAAQHPEHVVITLLATDGDPTSCTPDTIPGIAKLAADAANGMPKVLTFVIGVGDLKSNLDAIAQAGGTGQALIVDANQNVQQQFLDALNKIRGAALSCSYLIPLPEAGMPDFDTVNVQYTPGGGGEPVILPRVNGKLDCPEGGDAWYYDDPGSPTKIVLCESTCGKVSVDMSGQMDILLGCKTIIK